MLKKIRWQELAAAVLMALFGVLMFVKPDLTAMRLTQLIGLVFALIGAAFIIVYLVRRNAPPVGYDLAIGLIMVCIGAFFYLEADRLNDDISLFLGACIVISGIMKLQKAANIHRMGFSGWINLFILALLNVLIGLITIMNPFSSTQWLMRVLAAGLVYSGGAGCVLVLYAAVKLRDYEKNGKGGKAAAAEARTAAYYEEETYPGDTAEKSSDTAANADTAGTAGQNPTGASAQTDTREAAAEQDYTQNGQ